MVACLTHCARPSDASVIGNRHLGQTRCRPDVDAVSGSLRSELAEEAPVISSDEFLNEAPEVVKPEDVHEVPDDPGSRWFQGTGR